MRISACYIVKDEASELERSLACLAGRVDELVVVQTAASAAVQTAARQAGAKIFHFAWCDDFAAARNFALAQAAGDWLVLLDADEYFTPETACHLRGLIEAHKDADALLVPLTNLGPQGEKILTVPALRLARRQPGLAYQGRIHEELCLRGEPLAKLVLLDSSELQIYHTGYQAERSEEKARRNLRLLRSELRERLEHGEPVGSLYMYLAEAARGLGLDEETERWARLDIAQGRRQVQYASRSYHILLALLAKFPERREERCEIAEQAVQVFPELAEFRAELSACRAAWGDFAGAVRELEQALELVGQPTGLEPQQFGPAEAEQARKQLQVWQALAKKAEELDLTVCMIMKDEARELPCWLANAQAYAQNEDIIVVDTGSADNSREVAVRAGVRLYDFPWQGDFAAAKNFALKQAGFVSPPPPGAGDLVSGGGVSSAAHYAHGWLIFLDADETFYHPEGVRGLLAQTICRHPEADGFQVMMRHVDTDAAELPIGTEPVIRILRLQPGLSYQGSVHETPALHGVALAALPLAKGLLLRHTGYASSKVRAKARRNLRLLRRQKESPRDYRYLADACYALERYPEALRYAKLSLASGWQGLDGNKSLYSVALNSLARLHSPLGEQLALLQEAREQLPQAADLAVWQGLLLLRQGDGQAARLALAEALHSGQAAALAPWQSRLHAALGHLALDEGDRGEAGARLREALKHDPFEQLALALAVRLWPEPHICVEQLRPFYVSEAAGQQFLPQLGRWAGAKGHLPLLIHIQALLQEAGQEVPEAELCAAFSRAAGGTAQQLFARAAQDLQRLFIACLQFSLMQEADDPAQIPFACLEILPAELRRVAAAWQADEALPREDGGAYAAGLEIIIAGQARPLYERYAAMGLELAPPQQREAADKFFQQRAWAAAFVLYQALPADEIGEAGSFWHHLGLTLYHLGEYAAADECLERALAAGSRERDIDAFRNWAMKAQCEAG